MGVGGKADGSSGGSDSVKREGTGRPTPSFTSTESPFFDPVYPTCTISPIGDTTLAVDSFTVTFSEQVTDFSSEDISLLRDAAVVGPSTILTCVTTDSITWTVSGLAVDTAVDGDYSVAVLGVALGNGTAPQSLTKVRLATGDSEDWTKSTPANTNTISLGAVTTPRLTPVTSVAVTFTEITAGVAPSDFTLVRGASPLSLAAANIVGSGTAYSLGNLGSVTNVPGTYTLSFPTGAAVSPEVTNAPQTRTWTFETVPTASITAVSPDPRTTTVDSITIVFSEAVSNFNVDELVLTSNGNNVSLATATLSTSNNITFTLSNLAALTATIGTYQLVLSVGNIVDSAGFSLANPVVEAWVLDYANSTVSITEPSTPNEVSSIDVDFSVSVTGFDISECNLTLDGGADLLTGGQSVSGSGTAYSVGDLTTLTDEDGTYVFEVVAGNITPAVSNAPQQVTWVRDTTPPTVSITAVSPDPRTTPVSEIEIVFSEAVSGFDKSELILTNEFSSLSLATATLSSTDSITWTLAGLSTLTTPNGAYVLSLSQGNIQDAHGNGLAAGDTEVWTKNPSLSILTIDQPPNAIVSSIFFNFDTTISDFDVAGECRLYRDTGGGYGADLLVGTETLVTADDIEFEIQDLETLTNVEGTYKFEIIAGNATPTIDNAPQSVEWFYDITPPTVTISAVSPDPREVPVETITITFSEEVSGFDLNELSLVRANAVTTSVSLSPVSYTDLVPLDGVLAASSTHRWWRVPEQLSSFGTISGASPSSYLVALDLDGNDDTLGSFTPPSSVTITWEYEALVDDGLYDIDIRLAGQGSNSDSIWVEIPTGTLYDRQNLPVVTNSSGTFIQTGRGGASFAMVHAGLWKLGAGTHEIIIHMRETGQALNYVRVYDARLSSADNIVFTLLDLEDLTTANGSYALTVSIGNIQDLHGLALASPAQEGWSMGATEVEVEHPVFIFVPGVESLITVPVDELVVAFSDAVTNFNIAECALYYSEPGVDINYGANILTNLETITTADNITFTVGDLTLLTNVDGHYKFEVIQGNITPDVLNAPQSILWELDSTPPTASIVAVSPDPTTSAVSSISIVFSEYVTGFVIGDLTLYLDEAAQDLSGASLSTTDNIIWTLSSLTDETTPNGDYVLHLSTGVIQDRAGLGLVGPVTEVWRKNPVGVDVSIDPVSNVFNVDQISIHFTDQVFNFDITDCTLTRDGGGNLLTGSQFVIGDGDQDDFIAANLSSLTGTDGDYVFTVNAGNIVPVVSNAPQTVEWTRDTSGPTADIVDVTPDPRFNEVSSISIVWSEPVSNFDKSELSLTRNGVAVSLATATLTTSDSITFTLGNLSSLTNTAGTYVLTLVPGDIVGLNAVPPGFVSVTDTWVVNPNPIIISPVATTSTTSVNTISFNYATAVSGVTNSDFTLTRNGASVSLSGTSVNNISNNQFYTISGLSALTTQSGSYVFTWPSNANCSPPTSNAPQSISWIKDVVPDANISFVSPDPRFDPVSSITITWTEAVSNFDKSELALTRDGSPVSLSAASLTTSDNITFTLSSLAGLTATAGTYVLTLSPGNIVDGAGFPPGFITKTETWVVNPNLITFQTPSPVLNSALDEVFFNFECPTSGVALGDFGLTLDASPVTMTGASVAAVTGTSHYKITNMNGFTGDPGTYVLSFSSNTAVTPNTTNAPQSITWVKNAGPSAAISPVSPDPRTAPVSSITIVWNEAVDNFTKDELSLTLNGEDIDLTSATLTTSDDTTFTLGNLSSLTDDPGIYVLVLEPGDIVDADLAPPVFSSVAEAWQVLPNDITITAVTSPINTALDEVFFNFVGETTGVAVGDFTLTRNGSPVTMTGASISDLSVGRFYKITNMNGFTGTAGEYVLTWATNGNCSPPTTNAPQSITWVKNTAPSASIVPISPDPRFTPITDATIVWTEAITLFGVSEHIILTLDGDALTFVPTTETIQAENYTSRTDSSTHRWTVITSEAAGVGTLTGASGQYLQCLTLSGTESGAFSNSLAAPYVDFNFTAPSMGEYLFDINLAGTGATGDSVWFEVLNADVDHAESQPSGPSGSLLISRNTSAFLSTNAGRWWIGSSGTKTIRVYMREDGAAFDSITITHPLLTSADGITWTLNDLEDLTAEPGDYVLTVVANNAVDADGLGASFVSISDSWTVSPNNIAFIAVPDPSDVVSEIFFNFTAPTTGVDISDFTLERDSINVPLTGAAIATVSGSTHYKITGLDLLTDIDGEYELIFNGTVVPAAANAPESVSWTNETDPDIVFTVDIEDQPAEQEALSEVAIVFSSPVGADSFTLADISLTLDAGSNRIWEASGYWSDGFQNQTSGATFSQSALMSGDDPLYMLNLPDVTIVAGDVWTVRQGTPIKAISFIRPDTSSLVVMTGPATGSTSGYAEISIETGQSQGDIGIVWWWVDNNNYWRAVIDWDAAGDPIQIIRKVSGSDTTMATLATNRGASNRDKLAVRWSPTAISVFYGYQQGVAGLGAISLDELQQLDFTPTAPTTSQLNGAYLVGSDSSTGARLRSFWSGVWGEAANPGGPAVLTDSGDGVNWTLTNLDNYTGEYGDYALEITAGSGIVDEIGGPLDTGDLEEWTFVDPASLESVISIVPVSSITQSAVTTITVNFDQDVTGFGITNCSLTRDGGSNLIAGLSSLVVQDLPSSYRLTSLASFTGTDGVYEFTVSAGAISPAPNNAPQSVSWSKFTSLSVTSVVWENQANSSIDTQFVPENIPDRISITFNVPVVNFTKDDLTLVKRERAEFGGNSVKSLAAATLTDSGDAKTFYLTGFGTQLRNGIYQQPGQYVLTILNGGFQVNGVPSAVLNVSYESSMKLLGLVQPYSTGFCRWSNNNSALPLFPDFFPEYTPQHLFLNVFCGMRVPYSGTVPITNWANGFANPRAGLSNNGAVEHASTRFAQGIQRLHTANPSALGGQWSGNMMVGDADDPLISSSLNFYPTHDIDIRHFSGVQDINQINQPFLTNAAGTITCAYDHTGGVVERALTLTGGTWPSWAGTTAWIRVGLLYTQVYQVQTRVSDTVLQLTVASNPGGDVSSTANFVLFQPLMPPFLDPTLQHSAYIAIAESNTRNVFADATAAEASSGESDSSITRYDLIPRQDILIHDETSLVENGFEAQIAASNGPNMWGHRSLFNQRIKQKMIIGNTLWAANLGGTNFSENLTNNNLVTAPNPDYANITAATADYNACFHGICLEGNPCPDGIRSNAGVTQVMNNWRRFFDLNPDFFLLFHAAQSRNFHEAHSYVPIVSGEIFDGYTRPGHPGQPNFSGTWRALRITTSHDHHCFPAGFASGAPDRMFLQQLPVAAGILNNKNFAIYAESDTTFILIPEGLGSAAQSASSSILNGFSTGTLWSGAAGSSGFGVDTYATYRLIVGFCMMFTRTTDRWACSYGAANRPLLSASPAEDECWWWWPRILGAPTQATPTINFDSGSVVSRTFANGTLAVRRNLTNLGTNVANTVGGTGTGTRATRGTYWVEIT